ncbi:MAG: hypothetical protein OXI67_22220 [Candidatus Poribacteria bacterium]|nr:hypothetical protein [Candidatus Poribacteria bacterium]
MKKSLLIISCSGRKIKTPGAIPAYQRYDGQMYRVIAKAQREAYFPTDVLDIAIISAKLGFLKWDDKIEDYDQLMTDKQSDTLRASVQEDMRSFLDGKDYDKGYINLGARYRKTLEGFDWDEYFSKVIEAEGGIGKKLSQLKSWLVSLHQQGI